MSAKRERCLAPWSRARWCAFAFVVGMSITILEFGAVRLFAPFFGQSPLVWANVIGVVLFALAIGAALGGRLAERADPRRALAAITASAGVLACLPPFLGPAVARFLLPDGFAAGPALDLAALGSLAATIAVFSLPLTCLGAVSPLLIRAVEGQGPIGRSGGLALMASTLGAVAGGYLTTLALIPGIGTRRTLIGCGVLLLLCGALALGRLGPIRAVASCGLAALAAAAALERPAKGPGLPGDGVVLEAESTVQTIRVLDRMEWPAGSAEPPVRTRILALDEGDAEYHSIAVEGRVDTLGRYYDLFASLPELLEAERTEVSVLVLGFCAGSAWRVLDHVLGERLRMTGVELDACIVEAAHRHFAVPRADPRLTIAVADARVFVESLPREARFDLVIVDVYSQQQYVPFHVATVEFFAAVRAHLADDGVLCANLDARRAASELPRVIAGTVAAAGFERLACLPVPSFPSELLLARNVGRQPFLPARRLAAPFAATFERAWSRLYCHPPDDGAPVLTDDLAPIERIVEATLARAAGEP